MRRIWTIFFTGFALFIVTIIVLKNSGSGDWFFGLFEGIRTFSGLDYWCSAAGAVSFGILAHVVIGRGDGEKGGKGA
jgi:hypothetical protein